VSHDLDGGRCPYPGCEMGSLHSDQHYWDRNAIDAAIDWDVAPELKWTPDGFWFLRFPLKSQKMDRAT
jgi:hypothetical protein